MSTQITEQPGITDAPTRLTAGNEAIRLSEWRSFLRMLVVLFKMRVVSLLLMAAVAGAFLGAGGWPGLDILLLVLVTGGMAASGASALNQFIERQSDGLMRRTRTRPLVTGAIPRARVIVPIGMALVLMPSLAILPFNPALAFFLILGAVIYVGIYTLWLKPRTLLNIVIGGAAGSAAVMAGGAAAGAWRDPAVITLALLVFLWTPFHFWSLAILYRDDYQKAGVPMLPARTSVQAAAWWIMLHSLATTIAALALATYPALGWSYLLPVLVVTISLIRRNILLVRRPTRDNALSLFISSNIYLLVVLVAVCVSAQLSW